MTQDLPSTLQFLQLLWTVNQALELTSKRMALSLGITGPQRLVIRLIGRFPGISPGELAATMRSDPSTLTGVLQRLEGGRLIRRVPDASDARRVLLSLTPRGRVIDRVRSGTVEHAVSVALRGVSARDGACTARVVRRIAFTLLKMAGGPASNGNGSDRHRTESRGAARRRLRPAPPGGRSARRPR